MKTRIWYAGVLAVLALTSFVLASAAGARTLGEGAAIAGIKPAHAVAGQRVLIYGSNLGGMSNVTFGGVPSRSVVVDEGGGWIRAVVPPGAPVGQVPVTVSDGSSQLSVDMQIGAGSVPAAANRPPSYASRGAHVKVVVAPQIAGFSPIMGRVGSSVRIMGTHLGGAKWLKFGGALAHVMHSSSTSIIAKVPKHARTGKITVHTSGGTSLSVGVFRVLGSGAGI